MKNFREIETPSLKDFLSSIYLKKKLEHDFFTKNFDFTSSGKSSISLILNFLREEKFLLNKTYEVLVPEWLGYWVLILVGHWISLIKTHWT